jgi:hypothetical protein
VSDVESAGLTWKKSTFSETANCVEVAFGADTVHLRHARSPDGGTLVFTRSEWNAFLDGVRERQFDCPDSGSSS